MEGAAGAIVTSDEADADAGAGAGAGAGVAAALVAAMSPPLAALLLAAFAALVAALASPASAADAASRVPRPGVAAASPGRCVEDVQVMRRNHMELLKHHRDGTVRDGVRTVEHSLANCVSCHASKETGRVTGSDNAFCEGCHRYAAVKLDCFECHTDRAQTTVAAGALTGKPGVQ
jgi:hypothetical protein